MSKIAFLFPGQGAQYIGMGEELYNNFEEYRKVFEKTNEILDYSMEEVCFKSSEEFLSRTDNTQPALLATSIATLEILKSKGIECDATAGLSLGEYSALVCSGVISFEEALVLVKNRGKYMQECAEEQEGTLAAIIGLDFKEVEEAVNQNTEYGVVQIANLNCPKQIVIGGEITAVEKAMDTCIEKGARRAMKLNVSGPFHTKLLERAAERLEVDLKNISVNKINKPIVMNYTAEYLKDDDDLVEIMKNQVMSTVKFEDSIRKLIKDGFDTFVEIGPNKVLSGFVKKIDRKLTTLNVENIDSLNKVIEKLGVI